MCSLEEGKVCVLMHGEIASRDKRTFWIVDMVWADIET